MADLSFTMVEFIQVTSTKHLSITFLSFQMFGQRNLLITGNISLRMLSLFTNIKLELRNYGCPNISHL